MIVGPSDVVKFMKICTVSVSAFAVFFIFEFNNHITGMAEPKIIKFCTQVGYINSSNSMTYHPQKGCGYGHVAVLKFCRLP